MKLKDTIAEEFNEFSKNYTEDMTKCVPNYLELLDLFSKNIPSTLKPKRILDLGCGNGNAVGGLIKLFPEAQYTLVDASEDMLKLCQKRFSNQHITLCNTYFNDFHFNENEYDIISAGFSLHHCTAAEKQILYNKISQALTPNGVFMCSDLMVDKQQPEHKTLINYWEKFVAKHNTNEKWKWLMEHYEEFDKPNSISNHIEWLNNAKLTNYTFYVFNKHWCHFKAFKS